MLSPLFIPPLYTYRFLNKKIEGAERGIVSTRIIFCLKGRKFSEKNQLPSMILQRLRCHSRTQRLCPHGCGYYARSNSIDHLWKALTSTRMLEMIVASKWGNTDRIFSIGCYRILSIRCRTSGIHLCLHVLTFFFLAVNFWVSIRFTFSNLKGIGLWIYRGSS